MDRAEEAGASCFLVGGIEPNYDRRRKFPYYMAAASADVKDFVLQVQREVVATARAKRSQIDAC